MSKYTGPRCRQCRREGQKLFLKGERCMAKCPFDSPMNPRNYPPGQHGQRRGKPSEYGLQLREKQKVRRIYGVLEKQFRRIFRMAEQMPGMTGVNLLILLERRLDNVVYRMGFAASRSHARQLIAHGHMLVNGKKVDIPSYSVSSGDEIEVAVKMRENDLIKNALELNTIGVQPAWLEIDANKLRGKVTSLPGRDDIVLPVDEQLIVELYSKV
jgi:small subunit ribosomal protein S4